MEGAALSAPKLDCFPQMNEPESGRKHPPHHPFVERHNEPIIIFLTICSKDRKRILASADVVSVLRNAWASAKSWLLGHYVIMPDHVHLFCAPATIHHSLWSSGFATGKIWLQKIGHDQMNIPFGNAIFEILNSDGTKAMRQNGITF
jgi:hypothetical protein